MASYRKKQLDVLAWLYTGDMKGLPGWIDPRLIRAPVGSNVIFISTPDGEMKAGPGDWLVHDSFALFVVSGDYFTAHYERSPSADGADFPRDALSSGQTDFPATETRQ